MTQSTQSSSKRRLLYHFFIGNLARRNKRGRNPPASSSSTIPVQTLSLSDTDTNNNYYEQTTNHRNHQAEDNKQIKNKRPKNWNSDRIHYYSLTRYYVIVLMSLTTIILSSSLFLPTCIATATPDPMPIRISQSYSSFHTSSPKQRRRDSNSKSISSTSSSNKNSSIGDSNANSPLTSFSQPSYERLSAKENAFRPSYQYMSKNSSKQLYPVKSSFSFGERTTSTGAPPVTISNQRLSFDPFYNFINNFPSLTTSTERNPIRRSGNSNNNDNVYESQSQQAKTKKKRSRKRHRGHIEESFAFPLPTLFVTATAAPSTAKPTLHPLFVLETEMKTTTSSPISETTTTTPTTTFITSTSSNAPVKKYEPLVSQLLSPSVQIQDITEPNEGPYPDSGRANSGQTTGSSSSLISFENLDHHHRRPAKSKTKSIRRKSTTTSTTTENYMANHKSVFSPSFGVGGGAEPKGGDEKRLRSNFFENFHDTDIDNIAEESLDNVEIMLPGDTVEKGPHVNIPAGFTYDTKPEASNAEPDSVQEFHFSEATNGKNNRSPPKTSQNVHPQPPRQGFTSPSSYQAGGPSYMPTHQLPVRFPPSRPKLRPNLQSYYDDSYHKFTAAAENQYDNYDHSYGSRPLRPPPNYPPLPHLPVPIAIPMSAFPSPHHHYHPHHHRPPHPPFHYGNGHHHHQQHHPSDHFPNHYYGNSIQNGAPHQNGNGAPLSGPPNGNGNLLSAAGESGGTADAGPGEDNSIEHQDTRPNENVGSGSQQIVPAVIGTALTVSSTSDTYDLDSSGSGLSVHSNKKGSMMETFEVFYKQYKVLTWAAFLIVTSLALLCVVVFLYVNNPPTEVVTARTHLKEMLTSPPLLKFLTNLIEGNGGKFSNDTGGGGKRTSRSRPSRKNKDL